MPYLYWIEPVTSTSRQTHQCTCINWWLQWALTSLQPTAHTVSCNRRYAMHRGRLELYYSKCFGYHATNLDIASELDSISLRWERGGGEGESHSSQCGDSLIAGPGGGLISLISGRTIEAIGRWLVEWRTSPAEWDSEREQGTTCGDRGLTRRLRI